MPATRPTTDRPWSRRVTRLLRGVVACLLVPASLWAIAALHFDVPAPWLRTPLAATYALGLIAIWLWLCRPWKLIATAAAFALTLAWWLTLKPSNQRDWQPDVAVLPRAEIAGRLVTMHAIRDCDYRTEDDYVVRHYDRTLDLDQLRTVDLFLITWGSPHIAHTMISFGFDGGAHVCMSIETRKQTGERYSALRGFFRQYELAYIIADERDVVRLRTNHRKGELVYLYRLRSTPEQARTLFLDYVARANQLSENPEWYNALTANCTTAVRAQRAAADRAPWDWRMLVNGHLDELLYERGMIPAHLPLRELRARALINERARAADRSPDFSQLIRRGVPDFLP